MERFKASTIETHVIRYAESPERLQRIWDAIDRIWNPEPSWSVFFDTLDSLQITCGKKSASC